VPSSVTPNQAFNLIYTGPTFQDSTTVCVASNSAGDAKWVGTVSAAGGTVPMTAPATPDVYIYAIACTTDGQTFTAAAQLVDGVSPPGNGGVSLKVVPNSVHPNQGFTLFYTGTTTVDSTSTCAANNTAADPKWLGSQGVFGGSVALTAPAIPNIYTYSVVCTTDSHSFAAADKLFDGVPKPTDCGVSLNGAHVPTLNLLEPTAVVSPETTGVTVEAGVLQPNNIVDQDPNDFAILNLPVGLLNGSVGARVTDTTQTYPAGTLAGFQVSRPGDDGLLTLSLLSDITVSTLLDGVPADTAGATSASALQLDILSLMASPNRSFIGFITTKPFNAVQVNSGGLVSALAQTDVYQACVSTHVLSSSSSSSSSGGSSSSSSSSSSSGGSSSSSSSSSSGGSSSSSSSGGALPLGTASVSVAPNPVSAGGSFTLTYTLPVGVSCTASNTAGLAGWTGTAFSGSGTVTLTAPTTPNIYAFGLSCGTPPLAGTETAQANLYVGLASPVKADCGVNSAGSAVPTVGFTDTDSSVATTSSGGLTCLDCQVGQPENAVNADLSNYAYMDKTVALLSMNNQSLTINHNATISAGHTVGFVVANPTQVLTLALLNGLTVDTLLNGVTQDSANTSSSLQLDLLQLLGNPSQSFIGLTTTKPFNQVQINTNATLAQAVGEIDVYQACVTTP